MTMEHIFYFNSHAHVERDGRVLKCPDSMNISTHTLTWSVTIRRVRILATQGHFNSHAHVERDNFDEDEYENVTISTHTLTWSVTQID